MKLKLEVLLIRLAASLLDRNVERSMQITRRDNNRLFNIMFELRAIADRMEDGYKNR
jgi:hypothetical protein